MRQHALPPQAPHAPDGVRAPQARGSPCFRPLLPFPQSWLAPGSRALHGKQSFSEERVSAKMTDCLDASLPGCHLTSDCLDGSTTHCLPMTGALTASRDVNGEHGMEAEVKDVEESIERAADILEIGNVVSDIVHIAGASDMAAACSTPEPPLQCNAAPGSTHTGVAKSPHSNPLPAPEREKEPMVARRGRGRGLLKNSGSVMKNIEREQHGMTLPLHSLLLSPPHIHHRPRLGSLSERLLRPGLCPSSPGPGPCTPAQARPSGSLTGNVASANMRKQDAAGERI